MVSRSQKSGITSCRDTKRDTKRDTTLSGQLRTIQITHKQQTPENQGFASHMKQPETAKNIILGSVFARASAR
ncbi:MAG: hypothetical protein ACRDC6_31670, partial [Shewanella sp.]